MSMKQNIDGLVQVCVKPSALLIESMMPYINSQCNSNVL